MTSSPIYRGPTITQDLAGSENTAVVFDLATSVLLGDPGVFGMAAILLAGRNCRISCPSGRQQHRLRDRDYGVIE
jgi:hypothetical protein